ncbi:carbohydrate kinase [Halosimplex rubrum]|uniref:Carbohydrate kinase n=1 Tax=Halosimplex rubrum TaxID=869889 RepID=A0A7D5T0U3_9EURY|nr:carbohydrate kinase [Halosimplex rubrum]QLH78308.1 carbohydrate kinase [Halosimplex rubrum]
MDPSVLVAGETLVDFLPESDRPLESTERFARQPGGAPANVAVRLAQLDHTPWFWTRVGADPFGEFLAGVLADRGLPDRFVERDPSAKTTLAFVSGDPSSGPRFTFYRDGTADTRFRPGRVPDEALDAVEWVVVGSVLLASSPSREAVHDLVERAETRDCTVVFDLNARPELWPDADFEAETRRLLPSVDVVKASPEDLGPAGFDADAADDAALLDAVAPELHDLGPHTVFLTLGDRGAAASATAAAPWGADDATHDGYRVDAVDTTGAGDAFTAGAVAALVEGEDDLESVLARANAVAAASTMRAGGMAELPDPESVR